MSNIDWTEPIEYVDSDGDTSPAEDRGEMDRGKYRLVVIHGKNRTNGDCVFVVLSDGTQYKGGRQFIRNIPGPKREPRVVWISEERDVSWDEPIEGDEDGRVWRKFVEEIES